jgi:hypothetical protein
MPSPPKFKLIWSEKNRDAVRALGKKAIHRGLKKEFLDSIEFIIEKLSEEPLGWGDPLYSYKAMDLSLCHGIYFLLHIYYAVDENKQIVYVQELLPIPGLGLDDPGRDPAA